MSSQRMSTRRCYRCPQKYAQKDLTNDILDASCSQRLRGGTYLRVATEGPPSASFGCKWKNCAFALSTIGTHNYSPLSIEISEPATYNTKCQDPLCIYKGPRSVTLVPVSCSQGKTAMCRSRAIDKMQGIDYVILRYQHHIFQTELLCAVTKITVFKCPYVHVPG